MGSRGGLQDPGDWSGGQALLEIDICILSIFFMAALTNAVDIKYLTGILQSCEIQDEFVLCENPFAENPFAEYLTSFQTHMARDPS